MTLTGQEVLVDGATNEAHEKRTHEESRSGLSLSLSNSVISAGETFRGAVRTAQSRDNKTLQGLELVDAGRNLRKDLKGKSPADVTSVGLHVGIGSSSFKQESEVNQQTYAGGRMMSAGDVTVRAESSQENKGNLTAVGESIQGKNVSLTASGAVRLQAGTNEETIRDSYQSHGASIGASFHGGLTSIDASYGKMKDQGTTTRVTHTGSHVTAQDSLMTSSGKNTTLVGSQLQGQSVTVKTGGNLHIESVQDSETYRGNRSSTGISVAYSPSVDVQENFLPQGTHATHFTYTGTGAKSGNASYSRGKTTSDYASVTEQAGIYAGDQGYDVDVNKDTQLKGAVIASTADANRNHLTTGTLHLEDIQNKAAYDVKNTGVAYNHYASDQERNQHFNETGLTPDILPGAAKDAHSVTRSAISQGTIQVTQGVTDVTKINRDTAHALQTLNHIFDKQKVEERQELARLFAKNADELLHYYDRDGKFDKALAHGLVAEITSQIAGNKAGSGFAAGMTNELLINKIKEWAGNDPAKAQWISAALGATVNAAVGKNVQTGGATAQYGTKWNLFGDGHPGQKIVDVAIGIEHGLMGHTSLVMKFEDGTYEQANFGRYGGDGERISFGRYPAPNGSGTYTFDYNYYPGKDGQTLYWLNLNANDIAYYYNQTILNNGYHSYNPSNGIIIGIDHNGNEIYSGDSYRNGEEYDYQLLNNNCTTTTVLALYGPSGKDNWLLNDLSDEISPYIVNWKLKHWGFASGLVSKIDNPEED